MILCVLCAYIFELETPWTFHLEDYSGKDFCKKY